MAGADGNLENRITEADGNLEKRIAEADCNLNGNLHQKKVNTKITVCFS